jgi:hypothetical protein
MIIKRRVSEAEAISEFLKAEFYEKEFDRDRKQYESLVLRPDLGNARENAIRRALLLRRRSKMWRELPADVQWFEVDLSPEDLERMHVFPRAHWRRISNGSFLLRDIAKRVREAAIDKLEPAFAKIQAVREKLLRGEHESAVLLIGVNDREPLTIMEGNHRLTAAMLVSPELISRHFTILCGLSPNMTDCCWYRTSLRSMWRYLRNRFRYAIDREANLAYALEALDREEEREFARRDISQPSKASAK